MNNNVISDALGRGVNVYRNGVALTSGASYSAYETLGVQVNNFNLNSFEVAIEAKGARFVGGVFCIVGGVKSSRVAASIEFWVKCLHWYRFEYKACYNTTSSNWRGKHFGFICFKLWRC